MGGVRWVAFGLAILASFFLQGCIFGGDGGSSLSVPGRPGNIPTATPPASLPEPVLLGQSQPGAAGSPTPAAGGDSYVVKAGDSLSAIAAELNVPADQRAAWIAEVVRLNNLSSASAITVGQTLRLPRTTAQGGTPGPTGTPQAASTSTAATQTPAAAGTATPAAGAGSYTVVSGDTPLDIAAKLGVPPAQQVAWAAQLVSLNGLNPNALVVGQVLRLPPIP